MIADQATSPLWGRSGVSTPLWGVGGGTTAPSGGVWGSTWITPRWGDRGVMRSLGAHSQLEYMDTLMGSYMRDYMSSYDSSYTDTACREAHSLRSQPSMQVDITLAIHSTKLYSKTTNKPA